MKKSKLGEFFSNISLGSKIISLILITGIILCCLILIPNIRLIIIKSVENIVFHRELNHDKWMPFLLNSAILFIIIFIILFGIKVFVLINKETVWNQFYLIIVNNVKKTFDKICKIIVKFYYTNIFIFLFCGILGGFFFIRTFGVLVLDFTYTDWLMSGGDLSQHYTGWVLFRNSPWYFPLGLMDNIVHPFKESIIYTDSIPAFAIIFKLLSPFLPQNFQYFGLFGLIVYFLQGALGGLILKKLTKNTLYSIIASIFFILSTTMMQRIYGHTSLAGHFILLLCIYVCINNIIESKNEQHVRKYSLIINCLIWSGLYILAVNLHLYFVPMVFIFMIFYFLNFYLQNKMVKHIIISIGVSLVFLLMTMYILGAFYSNADKEGGGLGYFSSNLNTLFNPQGSSKFLKNLNQATDGQYEGFAYLGFGILLSIFFLIISSFNNINKYKLLLNNKNKQKILIVGFLCVLSFTIFAVSPVITWNSKILFQYTLGSLDNIWNIFRATGRFSWAVMYILFTVVFYSINKILNKKPAIFALLFLLLLQYYDLKEWMINKGNNYKASKQWNSRIVSPVWNDLSENFNHIFWLYDIPWNDMQKQWSILDRVGKNNLTINDSYLARKNNSVIEQNKQNERNGIIHGDAQTDTIYLFNSQPSSTMLDYLNLYKIDDYYIGLKEAPLYLDNYKLSILDLLSFYDFDLTNSEANNIPNVGVFGREQYGTQAAFCWIEPDVKIYLKQNHLNISSILNFDLAPTIFNIPTSQIIPSKIEFYINGILTHTESVSSGDRRVITIDTVDYPDIVQDSGYNLIEIKTNGVYNPSDAGDSSDARNLALQLFGIKQE